MRKMPKKPEKPIFLTILRIIILPVHYFLQEVNQSLCIDLFPQYNFFISILVNLNSYYLKLMKSSGSATITESSSGCS